MEGVLEGLAIKFVVHEMSIYGKGVDWAKLKADLDGKVMAMLPAFWGAEAKKAVDAVIDACAAAMQDVKDLQEVLDAVAAKDFAGAEGALVDMVGKLPGGHLFLQALGAA